MAEEKEQQYIDEISRLESENAILRRALYGKKSEKFIKVSDPNQEKMFEDSEILSEPAQFEKPETVTIEKHTKKKPKRQPLEISIPDNVERIEEIIEPDNKQDNFKKIGEHITEILEVKPAEIYVRRIIRPKYVTADGTVVIADMPEMVLPKSNAGSSVLTKLVIDKFVDHLPLHRQLKIYKREGINIAESTYSGWFTQTVRLLEPLYDTLVKNTLSTNYLKADESPMPVQTKDKKGATHKGYQWVVQNPRDNLTFFHYDKGRSKQVPKILFENFKNGVLQTDGYASYNEISKINNLTQLACWAHARRKFYDAIENDKSRAEYVLGLIQKLYSVERQAKEENMLESEILRLRKEKSVPILEEIKNYITAEKNKVLPKSKIGQAISYTLNLWHRLSKFVENGSYEIDNNSIENKIRPLALGRKNYMFAGSHDAAQRIAVMYSFLGTCAANNINPSKWMKIVLETIANHKADKLSELLPTKHNFPEMVM